MKFYSGFSLSNDVRFFEEIIYKTDYTIAGFSYGAIKAFEKLKDELAKGKRVDTLQLISPAFFQTKEEQFKRLQLMAYRKNEDVYLEQFINSCFDPYVRKSVDRETTVLDELQELLYYEWDLDALQKIESAGVKIEVYLGSEDKIIDVDKAREFFLKVATVTYIKNANHFLQKE